MLKYLIEKEFKQIFRNPVLPRLILVFPVIMMLIIPNAADMEVKDLRICVVDYDRSPLSSKLIFKAANSANLRVVEFAKSHKSALESFEADRADLILEIPAGFERDLMRESRAGTMVEANTVNATKGSIGSSYLLAVIEDFNREILKSPAATASGVEVITKSRFNPKMDYKIFMVPAMMVMMVTIICGFFPALNIVTEKEKGTIEQINVTPLRRRQFIIGKLIPYWIIGLFVLTITIILAKLFYNIVPEGNLAILYLFAVVYIFVVSGMGLIISNYSSTMQQAMFVMYFFIMILILMSGLFTPIESMPLWAKLITYLNPLRYFVEVVRAIYIKGSALSSVLNQLWTLIIFAALLNSWAILSYRKKS